MSAVVAPEPDRERARAAADTRLLRSRKEAEFAQRGCGSCLAHQVVADRERGALFRRDFHQAARHIHGIARGGDVLMAVAAEPRGDDRSEMGTHLDADARRNGWWQRFDPLPGAAAEVDAA